MAIAIKFCLVKIFIYIEALVSKIYRVYYTSNSQNMSGKFMTIKQAAGLLGVTPLTLRNWDKQGKLPTVRHPMSNYRIYKTEDIDKLIKDIDAGVIPTKAKPRKVLKRKLTVRSIVD
jgi:excisionase family DNA binding protein